LTLALTAISHHFHPTELIRTSVVDCVHFQPFLVYRSLPFPHLFFQVFHRFRSGDRASAYMLLIGNPVLQVSQITSSTMINSLSAEPWCNPTPISKLPVSSAVFSIQFLPRRARTV